MVVVSRLPKACPEFLLVQITRSLLKFRNESGQVAGFTCTFREKVNVIGHYAVRMDQISVVRSAACQPSHKPNSDSNLCKRGVTFVAAHRKKIDSGATIGEWVKSYSGPLEIHGRTLAHLLAV